MDDLEVQVGRYVAATDALELQVRAFTDLFEQLEALVKFPHKLALQQLHAQQPSKATQERTLSGRLETGDGEPVTDHVLCQHSPDDPALAMQGHNAVSASTERLIAVNGVSDSSLVGQQSLDVRKWLVEECLSSSPCKNGVVNESCRQSVENNGMENARVSDIPMQSLEECPVDVSCKQIPVDRNQLFRDISLHSSQLDLSRQGSAEDPLSLTGWYSDHQNLGQADNPQSPLADSLGTWFLGNQPLPDGRVQSTEDYSLDVSGKDASLG